MAAMMFASLLLLYNVCWLDASLLSACEVIGSLYACNERKDVKKNIKFEIFGHFSNSTILAINRTMNPLVCQALIGWWYGLVA